jgi:hypothetical protein
VSVPYELDLATALADALVEHYAQTKYEQQPSQNESLVQALDMVAGVSPIWGFLKAVSGVEADWDLVVYLMLLAVATIIGADNMDLPWITGTRGNGKDTWLRLISETLGTGSQNYTTVLEDEHVELRRRTGTEGPAPFFHAVKGAKMVVISEMEKRVDVARLKKLCDPMGVPQTTRALYVMPEQWRPTCTVWIGSNVPPDVSGQDERTIEAFQRRLALIPFPMEFRSPDEMPANPLPHQKVANDTIKRKMPESSPELLWWCMKLAPILLKSPYPMIQPRPAVVREAVAGFTRTPESSADRSSSLMDKFVQERVGTTTNSKEASLRTEVNAACAKDLGVSEYEAGVKLRAKGLENHKITKGHIYRQNVNGRLFYVVLKPKLSAQVGAPATAGAASGSTA